MLAAISGLDLVNFCVWLIDYVKVAEPFNRVLKVVIAVVAVLVIINALLAMTGNPVVRIG